MSKVTDAVRKAYPKYADVSDDDLTAAIGQAYPGYLDEQKFPDFSRRFNELDEDYNYDGGWLDGMSNAIRRGTLRAEMAGLVFDESTYGLKQQTPESAKRIAELNEKLSKVRGSSALQYYGSQEAKDDFTGRISSMFASFPEFLAESLTSQIVVGARIIPKIFGTTVATGTAVGAVSPDPITTVAGAGFGAMFGMAYGNGITSLAQEYTGTLMEVLSEHGIDTTNAEQLEAAFKSDEGKAILSSAREAAYSRGVPIAALDALSFGIAGRLGSVGKEMLLQSAMGGTGELAGQATSLAVTGKQRGNVEDVIIEAGVGAFADVLTDVVPAQLAKTGKLGKPEKTELENLLNDISDRQAELDEAESVEEDAILEETELALDEVDPLDEAADALSEKVELAVETPDRPVKGTLTPVVSDTEDGSFNSEADAAFGVQVGNTVDSVPYARFKSVILTNDNRVTARVTADGSLVVNPDELRANAEDSDLSQDEYIKRVVQEEAIHAAHLDWLKTQYVKETGDTKLQNFEQYFVQRMEAVAGEMTPEQVELVQGVYGSDIDGARLGLEYVRMLTQQRREGSVTEGTGVWEFYGTQPNPETRNYFKRAINWIRKRVQPKTRKKEATEAAEATKQLEGLASLLTDIEAKREATTAEPEAATEPIVETEPVAEAEPIATEEVAAEPVEPAAEIVPETEPVAEAEEAQPVTEAAQAEEVLDIPAIDSKELAEQTDASSPAVVEFFRKYADRMTDNSPDGDQAASDIWSHLWEAATKWLETNDNLSGFSTATVARNKAIDIQRGISRRGQTFLNETKTTTEETGESAVDTGKAPTLKPETREALDLVSEFFDQASESDKTLAPLLTDDKQTSVKDVAKKLNTSPNTVYQRKRRMTNRLRGFLEERGVDKSMINDLMQAAKKRKLSGDIVREARAKDLKGQKLKEFIKKKLEALPKEEQQQVLSELGIAKSNKPKPSKTADKAATASNNKTKRLKFTMSVEKSLANEQTKDKLDEYPRAHYEPITNKETLAKANARIDEIGMDAAKREVLDAVAPDATVSAMGIVLFQKFQAAGRLDDAIDIAMHVAEIAKTQGQAIQVLSIVSRLSPDGATLLAARIIKRAKAKPETKDAINKHIKSLGGEKKIIDRVNRKAKRLQRLRKEGKLNEITELSESAALLEEVMSVAPTTVLSKIRAFHTIMMLLNFKTAIRNLLGNVILFVPETVSDFADAAIDKTMSVVTGKRTKMRPFTYVANKFKGLPQPIIDFKAGMELARIEGESKRAQLQKGFDTMIMLARLTSQSKFELQDAKRMNARVFDSKAMRMLEDSLTVLLSPADRSFYMAAYKAELANQMQLADTDVPSKEMIEYAQLIGMRAIYQNDNFVSKGLQKAREGLNWITAGNKEFGLGEMFFKFTRVPGSLLLRGLEYSPAGFIRALYKLMPPVFGKQFNQREFVTAFSRASVGTGSAFSIGYMLEQLGVLTGAEAEDTDQRELEREMGFQRYSINVSALKRVLLSGNFFKPQKPEVGDFLVSYDWAQPVAMPMAMGAIVSQKQRTGKGEDDAASFMASMIGAGAKTLEEQPLVSGIFQLFQKFTYAKQELEANNPYGTVKALLDSYAELPATFVPTAVNQVNQYMDNVSRNSTASEGFDRLIDRVAARTPLLGGKMTERRTTTGQPRLKIPSGNTFINVFLNPAFTDTIKSDPIGNELMRLYRESGQKQQFPRKAKRSLTVNGERQKLDAEQIARYQHATGKLTIYRFDHLMRTDHYVSRGDEDRAKILANEMTDIGTAVKVLLFDHRPKTMRKAARRMLMELQQSGVDLKKI